LLAEQMPFRRATLGKELTKRHETFYYAENAGELADYFAEEQPRGEYVIVLGPPESAEGAQSEGGSSEQESQEEAVRMVAERVQRGESHASAVREVASLTGVRRKLLYQLTLGARSSAERSDESE
jgi:16S rRNA (cytidine1402-2'-O)-methyltransferase